MNAAMHRDILDEMLLQSATDLPQTGRAVYLSAGQQPQEFLISNKCHPFIHQLRSKVVTEEDRL